MLNRAREQGRLQSTYTQTWPAPLRGWVTAGNIQSLPLDAAERLDNFFCTAQGARLRRGSRKHATLTATPVQFLRYRSGVVAKLYASDATSIYDVTSPASATVVPVPVWDGLASGDWSSVQFATSGGQFTVAVNGSDHAVYTNGTNWNPIVAAGVNDLAYDALTAAFTVGETVTGGTSGATATILGIQPSSATAGTLRLGAITGGPFQDNEALTDGATGAATADGASASGSAVTITGVTTADLDSVWSFKERLFFIEKDSLSAWYLPVDSIGGAAGELNMGSLFRRGGNLLVGATWSVDSGSGLDDLCVFVTDQGEVAVYQGTNPASSTTWALVGLYEIGTPVNKHAAVPIGSDLAIITDDGIIPMSVVVSASLAQFRLQALSAPIEGAWRETIAQRTLSYPIMSAVWRSESLMIVGTPAEFEGKPVAYVVNVQTGAWSRYVGWDVRCAVEFGDALYFGADDNIVYQGEVSGNDDGTGYDCILVPAFSECGTTQEKFANFANLIARGTAKVIYRAKCFADYAPGTITAGQSIPEPSGAAIWGTTTWGTGVWGAGGNEMTTRTWKAVSGRGFALAPAYAIHVNTTAAPDIEITACQLRYEAGGPF